MLSRMSAPDQASSGSRSPPAAGPCVLNHDLGWALGALSRSYLQAVAATFAAVPGGPRGYQVLAAAAREEPGSQLALAQHLGVDRTVMTYLLDSLAEAGLIERRPDPADRRARRIVPPRRGLALLGRARRAAARGRGPGAGRPGRRQGPAVLPGPAAAGRGTRRHRPDLEACTAEPATPAAPATASPAGLPRARHSLRTPSLSAGDDSGAWQQARFPAKAPGVAWLRG